MVHQVNSVVQKFIETGIEVTEKGQALATAGLVTSIAFTILGIAMSGIFGTLLALAGGFSILISSDTLSMLNNLREMLNKPTDWLFIDRDLLRTQNVRDQEMIKKIEESLKDSIALKFLLPPLLHRINQKYALV